jgi:hypothetical protein
MLVGNAVGEGVGALVGEAVGEGVGALVGEAVGACVGYLVIVGEDVINGAHGSSLSSGGALHSLAQREKTPSVTSASSTHSRPRQQSSSTTQEEYLFLQFCWVSEIHTKSPFFGGSKSSPLSPIHALHSFSPR